jgi:hypothetical protein
VEKAIAPRARASTLAAATRSERWHAQALTLELKFVTRTIPETGGMDAWTQARDSITIAPVAASRVTLRW